MPVVDCPKCNGSGKLPLFTGTYDCDFCVKGQVYVSPEDTLPYGQVSAFDDTDDLGEDDLDALIADLFQGLDTCLD